MHCGTYLLTYLLRMINDNMNLVQNKTFFISPALLTLKRDPIKPHYFAFMTKICIVATIRQTWCVNILYSKSYLCKNHNMQCISNWGQNFYEVVCICIFPSISNQINWIESNKISLLSKLFGARCTLNTLFNSDS